MATIAVYNLKGGVGKTTMAVNLAWLSAQFSARRTLLWDLDPQAASTFLFGVTAKKKQGAATLFARNTDPLELVQPTAIDGVDILAADTSLRGLDRILFELGKKRRLAKLIERLTKDYDRIILDCPPGLTETTEQVMRAANLIIVPVIPSALSQRAFEEVVAFMDQKKGRQAALLPVHSMVDLRRTLHRDAVTLHDDWPIIPMSSVVEKMSALQRPLGSFAASSSAAKAYVRIWRAIENKLAQQQK